MHRQQSLSSTGFPAEMCGVVGERVQNFVEVSSLRIGKRIAEPPLSGSKVGADGLGIGPAPLRREAGQRGASIRRVADPSCDKSPLLESPKLVREPARLPSHAAGAVRRLHAVPAGAHKVRDHAELGIRESGVFAQVASDLAPEKLHRRDEVLPCSQALAADH